MGTGSYFQLISAVLISTDRMISGVRLKNLDLVSSIKILSYSNRI